MVYQKFGSAEILTPFVECYFAWESDEPLEKELVVESPPNSYCSIARVGCHGGISLSYHSTGLHAADH